ncbi:hypothetical protein N0V82_008253 [Gnomoniopsis sp. IMI 355080]|nr:hypothetical protein N0V82_008253 [Gnomoniopsis sp. IMI 355080]
MGRLTSVPGSTMDLNATIVHMDDFSVVNSADGPYDLSARGILETDDGHFISVTGLGMLANTPHIQAILTNETAVEPTQWGEIQTLTTWSFQASGPYAALTESTFFANIRLFPSNNEDTAAYVEYRLSKVLPGPVCTSPLEDMEAQRVVGTATDEL